MSECALNDGILTIRSHSGLSGDMMLAGLAALFFELRGLAPDSAQADQTLAEICGKVMPELADALCIRRREVGGIGGWGAQVSLPHAHEHRSLADILAIIHASAMPVEAANLAAICFEMLATCEAAVHGVKAYEVHFHEVGALDSILDICVSCSLYVELGMPLLVCGSLPLADGSINCAHGIIPAPAPAVLRLLKGVVTRPFAGAPESGELVTPTAIALLQALNAEFGPWPEFRIIATALVYGEKEFSGVANGAIFALGGKMHQ